MHTVRMRALAVLVAALLSASPQADRKPVPDKAAQEEMRKNLRELLKKEYARQDAEGRLALAAALMKLSRETTDDDTARYVILCEARDAAAAAGDVDCVLDAVGLLAKGYDVDAGELTFEALEKARRYVRSTEALGRLARAYYRVAQEALAADDYDTALRAAREASSYARRAKESGLAEEAGELVKQIPTLKRDYEAARKAELALTVNPEDPEASLTLGRYLCFRKEQWKEGVKFLSQGSDEKLRRAAKLELEAPKEASEQVAVADAWWDASKSSPKSEREAVLQRARSWYERALSKLGGLAKIRVEKRLGEIQKAGASSGSPQSQRTIDLIRLVDPRKHTIKGSWKVTGGQLILTAPSEASRIRFPVIPRGSYDVEARFTRTQGDRSFGIILPVADRGVGAFVSWKYSDKWCHGLSMIKGEPAHANKTRHLRGVIEQNRAYTLLLRVRLRGASGASIEALLDGRPCFNWEGPLEDLTQKVTYSIKAPISLGWSANFNALTIHSLRLRMISGKAEFLR